MGGEPAQSPRLTNSLTPRPSPLDAQTALLSTVRPPSSRQSDRPPLDSLAISAPNDISWSLFPLCDASHVEPDNTSQPRDRDHRRPDLRDRSPPRKFADSGLYPSGRLCLPDGIGRTVKQCRCQRDRSVDLRGMSPTRIHQRQSESVCKVGGSDTAQLDVR
jgi:hypothetical protein